jgi:hypothetical protein
MSSGRAHKTRIARALTVTGAVMTLASTAAAQRSGCTPAARRDALRAMQAQVLAVAPQRLDVWMGEDGTPIVSFANPLNALPNWTDGVSATGNGGP